MNLRLIIITILVWAGIHTPASAQSTYEDWCNLAATAIEQDSLAQAETYLLKAIEADPANPHNALLFSNLGTIRRDQHKYEKALEAYSFALNFAPRAVPILMNRATLYMELGQEDRARVDYSLVIDLEPHHQEALLMRAYIYMRQHNYKASKADYDTLLALAPTHYNGGLGLATLEQQSGKPAAALTILDEMILQAKDLPASQRAVLYTARADVANDMAHPDAALIDLEEAIRLDPSQAEAYLIRGQIYLDQKKKAQARQEFEKAIAHGVPRADLRDLLQQCQ